MSTTKFDAPDARRARFGRGRQVLLACLTGSLILHLAALALFPELKRDLPAPPAKALDVALVKVEPPHTLRATPPEARHTSATTAQEKAEPAPKRGAGPKPRIPDPPRLALPEPGPAPEARRAVAAAAVEPSEPGTVASPSAVATAPQDHGLQSTPPGFSAQYLRNPAPSYPLIARRNGEQGTVTLRVLVTRDGVPAQVSVEKSSGSSRLDDAALEAVKTWRFVPARRGAEAVEAWVLVPVVFRLEGVS